MRNPVLIDLPDELVGERVVVRPFADSDADALYQAIDESREHLMPWMPWSQDYHSVEDARAYTRRSRANWLLRQELAVGIFERGSGRVLGGSGLARINWERRLFEIGYWLRATAQGHGYMQETVRLLTRLAFDDLQANRVEIRMDARNVRSKRVPERLGFVFEGTLRRAGELDESGRPADRHVYALIREDFELLDWARGGLG